MSSWSKTHVAVAVAAALVSTSAGAGPAGGGSVRGRVTGEQLDVATVVVYLEGASLRRTVPAKQPVINQSGKQFSPRVLPVVKGTTVVFPNQDPFMHNVFSLTKGNEFDLGYYRKGGTGKAVKFDNAGSVDIYCNIHPSMAATILVLENDYYVRPAADGSFALADVPPGTYDLVLWTPYIKPVRRKVVVDATHAPVVELQVPRATRSDAHLNKENLPYGRYK